MNKYIEMSDMWIINWKFINLILHQILKINPLIILLCYLIWKKWYTLILKLFKYIKLIFKSKK